MSHTHDDEQSRSVEQALYLRDLYRWAPAPAPQQPPREPAQPATDSTETPS